jgi:hypothetical protein
LAVKRISLCIVLLATLALVPRVSRAGDLVFSVSPGSTVESAQVGKHMGNWMPYFGLDLLGISAKASPKSDYSYVSGGTTYREVSSDEIEGSANLIVPHIGARLYFGDAKKDVRPYVYGDLLKSFAFVSGSSKGSSADYANGVVTSTSSYDHSLSDDDKDQLQQILGVLGVSGGFGCEYSFSERFSVGGEYGVRYFHTSTEGRTTTDSGSFGLNDLMSSELSGSLKYSTARLWLNFRL